MNKFVSFTIFVMFSSSLYCRNLHHTGSSLLLDFAMRGTLLSLASSEYSSPADWAMSLNSRCVEKRRK